MENKMNLKLLNKKDIDKVYLLGKKEFGKQDWYDKEFIVRTLKNSKLSYGLFDKKKLIGVISVDFLDKPKAWIDFFIIEKDYRRKGYGCFLLKKMIKNLPKEYFLILVDVGEKDISAKKFYKKNGFTREATFKKWFGKKEDGLIYVKRLK